MKPYHLLLSLSLIMVSCSPSDKNRKEAQKFLDAYNQRYQEVYTASSNGQWMVNTHIVEGDTMNAFRSRQADEAMARFTGSEENITSARKLLAFEKDLLPIQVKQLKKILYLAAGNPATDSVTVKELIAAGTAQTERLYGFKFQMDGKEVTPNDIDSMLNDVKDTLMRRKAWETSKSVGADLKNGLVHLRELRNNVVKGLGYSDYFSYQVSDYGMTSEEMMQLLDKFNKELYPLYRELH
ncbi:MAG: M2 family metallopeptidase, partial [Flavobacteriales bacterium]